MKKSKWAILAAISMIAVCSVLDVASASRRTRGDGGNDVPTPHMASNLTVELAEGEYYTLVGVARLYSGGVFFEVDLNEHPWLANNKRKSAPFYPLEGSTSYWKRYDKMRVRLLVEAHGSIYMTGDRQHAEYVLSLSPLAEPIQLNNRIR